MSINDTLLLKGIGILLIVTHNFFHLLKPGTGENEFSYAKKYLINFVSNVNSDSLNSFQYFISYFGHYGVQIFIFISGYGLTVAYGSKMLNFKNFIFKRLIKIYPAFSIAIILLLIYHHVIFDMPFSYKTIGLVFIRYTMIANWMPNFIWALSGPYWFYSMIIQLYLCFPLLLMLHKKSKYSLWFILIASYVFILITDDFFISIKLNLFYNFIGNLPVFILGIILAVNKTWKYSIWIFILSIFVFILGQFNNYIWYFSQISFTLIVLPIIIGFFQNHKKNLVYKFLIFTGHLSMYLFAVNGFMRRPWIDMSNNASLKIYRYLYFIIFILLIFIVSLFIRGVEKKLMNWLRKKIPILNPKSS